MRCFAKVLVPGAAGGLRRASSGSGPNGGLSPADLYAAYHLDGSRGAGMTIAVVEGYRYANIDSDLAVYRSYFGLPPCRTSTGCLVELNQNGAASPLPGPDPTDQLGNQQETMLDLDAASATCPQCRLVVVEADTLTTITPLLVAMRTAIARANAVSLSIGGGEPPLSDETSYDQAYLSNSRGVAVAVAAGDCGAGTSYPSASPYVTSVGGTTLTRNGSARGWGETVWNSGPSTSSGCGSGSADSTGSGCTQEPRPPWQPAIGGCTTRIMNDVAAAADPANGGLAVYDGGRWDVIGGTSESAPIIAGAYAEGGGEGFATGAFPLYRAPSTFDVVSGYDTASPTSNPLYAAQPGFDGPTGLGTPNGPIQPVPPPPSGYWLVASDGGLFPFGNAGGYGSTGGMTLNRPIVQMAATDTGRGYWLVASDGGIFPFGDAQSRSYGSTGGIHLNQPIVAMARTQSGQGYWLVASDGGIFPFGDATAHSYGSTGGIALNRPIVGMAVTETGNGYWLVASDGGIFPFGDAQSRSYGSTGGIVLNRPIVGMAATETGRGYWLVASDGGIFPFGDAQSRSYGSTGGMVLNRPIVGMSRTGDGHGYWLVASDGGIFPFGDAPGYGSTGGMTLNQPIVGMAGS